MKKSLVFFVLFFILVLTQSAFALGSYSVVKSHYADPYSININLMTRLSSMLPLVWNNLNLASPCVDGSGASTFAMVKKGSVNNLLIYFEGGGACADYTTCGNILSGGKVTTLNPSFATSSLAATLGIFNNANLLNPFLGWTVIYLPFGTGDIHMGNRVVKYWSGSSSKTVYHVGAVNATVAMRWAKAQGSWNKVVVAGSSAGGYGTIMHTYTANKIFGKPIYTINDSGPGLNASPSGTMANNEDIGNRWGSWQNFPAGSIADKSKPLLYFVEYTLKNCTGCYYGLYDTLQDSIISSFEDLSGLEHGAQLLKVSKDIDSRWDSRFCYYLPLGIGHTILIMDTFYTTSLNGSLLLNWVNNIINGSCSDRSAF